MAEDFATTCHELQKINSEHLVISYLSMALKSSQKPNILLKNNS